MGGTGGPKVPSIEATALELHLLALVTRCQPETLPHRCCDVLGLVLSPPALPCCWGLKGVGNVPP